MRTKLRLSLYKSKLFKRRKKFPYLKTPKRLKSPLAIRKSIVTPSKSVCTPRPYSCRKQNTPLKLTRTPTKFRSPFKVKKRPVTPLTKTPKRIRLLDSEWEEFEVESVSSEPPIELEHLSFCDNDEDEFCNLATRAFEVLTEAGLKDQFLAFFELVANNVFPLDNLSLLLFLETVKFYYCSSTTEMRYSDVTKRFWKTGYRLFHAKFLYFMGGPKNIGTLAENPTRGKFSPMDANINFAIPSVSTLDSFKVSEIELPKRMPTGVIEPVLERLSSFSANTAYMLCADGKKVTAGVDKVGGDVDMFGFEDAEKLSERMQRLEKEMMMFDSLILDLKDGLDIDSSEKRPITVTRLKECNAVISKRLQEARELKKNQEFGLSRFKALGGEKWKESKYIYAISGLQASLYQIDEYITQALDVVKQLCKYIALLEGSITAIPDLETRAIDISEQGNMLLLKSREDTCVVESRFVKQRTEFWHVIRDRAPVTGSTIHNALGLRGRKEQAKHIDKVVNKTEEEFPDDVKTRMLYGTVNEINALATFVGIVMPAYFPNYYYVEEGCYVSPGEKRDILLVVSPDGSIREVEKSVGELSGVGNAIAAIEVKCPFPQENKVPVHYSLPEYYVCQCLAEMYVLRTDKLLYISYSTESSTVLEVRFDGVLWDMIHNYISDIYDNDSPKVPKATKTLDIRSKIKDFVKTNVTFVVEVPSLTSRDGGSWQISSNLPFQYAKGEVIRALPELSIKAIIETLKTSKASNETCYNLQRRKATEVMVWVLTNINRNSSAEIPCSVPVAYGLKDYKLTSAAMRKATNYVLEKLCERGIRVCSFSTDGQWINLMVRDANDNPLTLLQLQRDVWTKAQKISKQELVKQFGGLNKVKDESADILSNIAISKNELNGLIVESKDRAFATVRTSYDIRLWFGKKKSQTALAEDDISENMHDNVAVNTQWMPENLIQSFQTTDDVDLQNAVRDINSELFQTESNTNLPNKPGAISADSQAAGDDGLEDTAEDDLRHNFGDSTYDDSGSMDQEGMDDKNVLTGESRSETEKTAVLVADPTDINSLSEHNIVKFPFNNATEATIYSSLKNLDVFKTWDTEKLHLILTSKEEMALLTHKHLNCLYESLKALCADVPVLCKSWKKERKVCVLYSFIHGVEPEKALATKKRKIRSPQCLSTLCLKVLRSRKVPKPVLNVAYASYIYSDQLQKWFETLPIKPDIIIKGFESDIQYWYSYPDKNCATQTLIGNSIDCSHNFTHLRVRSCTTGIGNVTCEAWKAVAKSNETRLNIALVEDLLDKQSVPNARTNFSVEVENWMLAHGYVEAANVTNIIRSWYDASDSPGISADKRIHDLNWMRNFLLKDVEFGKFPPPGRYINKIPIVTFEGILVDIDTKLQMYAITGPYNIRSVGSLAAETMVGILQEMNPTTGVSIKARDVQSLMSSVVEVMTCKTNPNRGFFMRTSRGSGVYPVHESDTNVSCCQSESLSSTSPTVIIPRDHTFDKEDRQKPNRKIRFGTVSGPSMPSRGARSVREFHHRDESKILKTKRLGKKLND